MALAEAKTPRMAAAIFMVLLLKDNRNNRKTQKRESFLLVESRSSCPGKVIMAPTVDMAEVIHAEATWRDDPDKSQTLIETELLYTTPYTTDDGE